MIIVRSSKKKTVSTNAIYLKCSLIFFYGAFFTGAFVLEIKAARVKAMSLVDCTVILSKAKCHSIGLLRLDCTMSVLA